MSEELCICGHKVYRHHNGYSYCTGCECANFEATRAEAERPKVELPMPSGPWCGRWRGSLPQRGWSIVKDRDVIAYLGPDAPSEAVTAIVYAHNIEIVELKARLQK